MPSSGVCLATTPDNASQIAQSETTPHNAKKKSKNKRRQKTQDFAVFGFSVLVFSV